MIKLKKIKPMYTTVITTMDRYENDEAVNGVIDTSKRKGTLKEHQKVIAVGASVRDITEGDFVCINPERYAVKKWHEDSLKNNIVCHNPVVSYNFNTIEVNGQQCLILQDRDIEFIIEDYEEVESNPANIILPESTGIII
jgi:co-chaperonin GroES (HSP10)